jgi:hypothetical protein
MKERMAWLLEKFLTPSARPKASKQNCTVGLCRGGTVTIATVTLSLPATYQPETRLTASSLNGSPANKRRIDMSVTLGILGLDNVTITTPAIDTRHVGGMQLRGDRV